MDKLNHVDYMRYAGYIFDPVFIHDSSLGL